MKKSIILTALTLILIISCAKKEEDKKENFLKDFKLDLSDLDIDFYKPYTQAYHSEMQRDSIMTELTKEIAESVKNNDGTEVTKTIKVLITVSEESNTITTQLMKTDEIDFSSWKNLGIYSDAESLNAKMKEIMTQNPSAEFGVQLNLSSTQINLYYKE